MNDYKYKKMWNELKSTFLKQVNEYKNNDLNYKEYLIRHFNLSHMQAMEKKMIEMNKHEFFWRALKNKLLNESEESFCVLDFMNMMEQSISNDDYNTYFGALMKNKEDKNDER